MSGSRLPIRFYNDGTDKIAVAKQGNPQLTVADSTFVSGAVAFGGGVVISGILLAAAARQRLTLVDSL